jgi:SAM-dependent methyltransferase
LKRSHRILDYGCGSGVFVQYLRRRGYARAVGYDLYAPSHRDPALLDATYDCIVSQDVIEHVEDPLALLRLFDRIAAPGAIVSIGTPNAEAIDLDRPDDFVHTLHQPYHQCILSKGALLTAGQSLGWRLDRYYPKQYSNLLLPGLNQRFFLQYVKCFDDTMDVVFERPSFKWALLSPRMLLLAFFGWFFSFELDVMALFRRPEVHGPAYVHDAATTCASVTHGPAAVHPDGC